MNEALMALYKEHKVNPLGGCLPLLIQAPIWIVYRVFIGLTKIDRRRANLRPQLPRPLDRALPVAVTSTEMNAFGLNLAESAVQRSRRASSRRSPTSWWRSSW